MKHSAHAFILAGGRGTRFWPLSRHSKPKQLLDFTGEGTLLALTSERLDPLIPPERQWVITSEDLADAVRKAVPQIPAEQVIAEPMGRNTAPAVALAAALLLERGEDVPFTILPSDHLITPAADFRDSLQRALEIAAESSQLVTFGVVPTRAETGYGYIECADEVVDASPARKVAAFREKPDRETAEQYLASDRYLWNSGMFCWQASVVAEGLRRHAAEVWDPVEALAKGQALGTPGFVEAFKKAYEAAPSISIDYALMENADNVVVLPATFQWNDLGHWLAMRDLWPKDDADNAKRGELLALDSSRNVVYGPDRLTALIGVNDLVVVTTEDVTLVCPADQAQEVKRAITALEDLGSKDYS